ncbi:FecR domain-containing protein [Ancylomarina sp. DW003]|nr:FecR domain-containing protein [Ancylomarina sp. DW003]MDE5422493.1 FecR domain-containing protein [Ancylomarina sp. DW003]
MKKNNQHINDDFLARFLVGETTKEEQKRIISWLEDKNENRKHLDQLEKLWLESGKLKPRPIFVNKKLAWANLSYRIKQYEKITTSSVKSNKRFRIGLITSIAASVLALIGLFNWYVNDTVQPADFFLANQNQSTLQDTLPDGSKIYLNQLTEVSYQTTNDKQRIVHLKGEAFFKVKRDTLRPFIIHAGIGGVKVLGTSFKVKVEANGDIAVDVSSGRVELFRPNKTKSDTIHLVLNKDEAALISAQQDTIRPLSSNSSAFFWVDKRLSFRNKPLKEVFEVLEACYGIRIKVDNPIINTLYYSSSFIDEKAEKIIQVISQTYNLTYTKEGDTFTLYDAKTDE